MAKVLKIIGAVVAIAGLAIVTGGAALGLGLTLSTTAFGVSAGALLAAGAVINAAGSLLAPRPKAPDVSSNNADRLTASIDLRAARKIVFGTTAMATDIRDQEFTDSQTYLHRFVVVASHKVNSITEIWFDDKKAWSASGGVTSDFAGYLELDITPEGSAADAINISARMGATRRYTGCAYVYFRYKLTGNDKKTASPFAQSIPSRMTIIGNGALVYDPRLDSTRGGSGSQRANDQTTWVWSGDASRNPALCLLWYMLGWRIQNPVTSAYKLAVGKGIPPARIDFDSFITAANLCDEAVGRSAGGTEPRYRCDGVFGENDDPALVLDNLKACMNAVLDDVDGKIRLTVLSNDLASPIGSLTTDDVLGEFRWDQTPPLSDTFNVIRGGYTDASTTSLYQLVDGPEQSFTSPDGIDRIETINLPLVQSSSQRARLLKQRLQRMLYSGTFSAEFQATAWKFQKGDVIRLTFAPLGFSEKLFRIADMAIRVDGVVPMVLREENTAIYAWDSDDAAAVVGAEPTTYNPLISPVAQGIDDAAGTAVWDNITGDGKPEDDATVGAPSGTGVAGRPAEDVISGIDDNDIRQAVLAAEAETARLRVRALNYPGPAGESHFTLAIREQTARAEANDVFAETFNLLGAVDTGRTAFVLDLDTVKVGASETFAQRLSLIDSTFGTVNAAISTNATAIASEASARATAVSTLTASLGDTNASVTTIETALANEGGGVARALLRLDVDGRIIGYAAYNDGETGDFIITTDRFALVDPDTGVEYLYADVDGNVFLRNVEVDTIKARAITGTGLNLGSLGSAGFYFRDADVTAAFTGWTDIATVTVTPAFGKPLLIHGSAFARSPDSGSTPGNIRLVRIAAGVTTIISGGDSAASRLRVDADGETVAMACVDGSVQGQATTFSFQMKRASSGERILCAHRYMSVVEQAHVDVQTFDIAAATGEGPAAGATGGGGVGVYNPNQMLSDPRDP